MTAPRSRVGNSAPVGSRYPLRSAFTLIEMLVVVSIIMLLASLIAPSLAKVRERARVMRCANNMRQMGIALASYASEHGEYPTLYPNSLNNVSSYINSQGVEKTGHLGRSHNWGDEGSGKWYGSPPDKVPNWLSPASNPEVYFHYFTDRNENLLPDSSIKRHSAWALLAADGYVPYDDRGFPTGINLCTATLPAPGFTFYGGSHSTTFPLYAYNGPHTYSGGLENNGNQNGLYYMGRGHQGVVWGVSARKTPEMRNLTKSGGRRFQVSDIAMLGCPSIRPRKGSGYDIMFEPHGHRGASPDGGQSAVRGALGLYKFDRNYLFGDMHVLYVSSPTRVNIPE